MSERRGGVRRVKQCQARWCFGDKHQHLRQQHSKTARVREAEEEASAKYL
jgi:hypothetical protein